MIKEEIKLIKESRGDLRKFGITVGLVLAVISGLLFYFEKPLYIYFAAPGIFLILTGIIYPEILKPINKLWMILAILLGWLMTRVILSVLFYLVITPIGLIARLSGKKFLELKIDNSKETYWEKRDKKDFAAIDYERQF